MMARQPRTTPQPGADLPVVANPATGETSEKIWRRWSVERADRERVARLRAQARAEADSERGIYPIEIARQVAHHAAAGACPEWRYLKDLIPSEYGRILREQPEMRQRDVKAREQIILALFNALPAHLHGALGELRTVMELVGTARETTTFLLGFEIGREAGRQLAVRDPRVMLAPDPQKRAPKDDSHTHTQIAEGTRQPARSAGGHDEGAERPGRRGPGVKGAIGFVG